MSIVFSSLFDGGHERRLAPSEPLFHRGDPVKFVYLVSEGKMQLTRQTSSGIAVTVQVAGPGQMLAEASAYSRTYHCDAHAVTQASLRAVPQKSFRKRLANDTEAAEGWAMYLAHAVQAARLRAEIRTLRTVAERLDAWLVEAGPLPDRGDWTRLAGELGVSRESLYRELARRRQHAG